jgi:hypothetical protein
MGLWDVEVPTFSGQSAHRWRWGCQPYAPAGRPLPTGRFLVLISVTSWIDRRGHNAAEELGQLKNPTTSSGDLPACSIVPQPTTLPRASHCSHIKKNSSRFQAETGSSSHKGLQSKSIQNYSYVNTTRRKPKAYSEFHTLLLAWKAILNIFQLDIALGVQFKIRTRLEKGVSRTSVSNLK